MPEQIEGEVVDAQHRPLAIRDEAESAMLAPVVSPAEAKAAMNAYYELCEAVLDDADYQEFWQYDPAQKKKVKKRFKKKSAVKKLQTFWGVTVTAPDAIRDELGDGHFAFRVRAIAKKGNREVEAWGACSTLEERFDLVQKDDESASAFDARQRKALARAYHDVLGTAETRATNRAVMNVIGVGGGEVTADEMSASRTREADEETLPPCPECGKPDSVLRDRDHPTRLFCWKKRGGCGANFGAPENAQIEPKPSEPQGTAKTHPEPAQAPKTAVSEGEQAEKRSLWAKIKEYDADARLDANQRIHVYKDAAGVFNRNNLKSIDQMQAVIDAYEIAFKQADETWDAANKLLEQEPLF